MIKKRSPDKSAFTANSLIVGSTNHPVGPVHPVPPHWPYCATVPEEPVFVGGGEEVVPDPPVEAGGLEGA